MDEYSARIFGLCLRLTRDWFTAEDLTQDTFLSAFQALERFDGANEAAWLSTIAARKCLDHLRSAATRHTRAAPDETLLLFPSPASMEPENIFFEEHWEGALRGACEALKEPYRETALGYYCEGRSLAEIARRGGVPHDTARTRCYRAKQMLREILREEVRVCAI
ncbi:MAG: RNA polymerase sigma factor [Firmicutes bacterium]|nr:RNA polymerase sigma factor [Bacillota bacterium]